MGRGDVEPREVMQVGRLLANVRQVHDNRVPVVAGTTGEVVRSPVFVVQPHGSRHQVLHELPEGGDVVVLGVAGKDGVLLMLLLVSVCLYNLPTVKPTELLELAAFCPVQQFVSVERRTACKCVCVCVLTNKRRGRWCYIYIFSF